MECVPPLDARDETLGCACLRWTGTDAGEDDSEWGAVLKENDYAVARKCFGAIPFLIILSNVHIVRESFAVHPITAKLLWTHSRFYINMFFRKSRTRTNRMRGKQ